MSRSLVALALAGAALAGSSCGIHSTVECSDTIPCPEGMECSPDGVCVLVLPPDAGARGPGPFDCGDGFCDGGRGEDCAVCPEDCGVCPGRCGDGLCDPFAGEDCVNCPVDCRECPA